MMNQNTEDSFKKRENFAISMRKAKRHKLMMLKRKKMAQYEPTLSSEQLNDPKNQLLFNSKIFSQKSSKQSNQIDSSDGSTTPQDHEYWAYKPWKEDNY